MTFQLRFDESGNHIRFADAIAMIGNERQAHSAFRRAINRTGDTARTATFRSLARQIGLSQSKTKSLGKFQISRANFSKLEYTIETSGTEIPLKEFGAKQFSYGVRARPWGVSRQFRGTFIFAGTPTSGQVVAGGHVFRRTSSKSLPIERLFGPSIPKEIVKDESKEAWEEAALNLGPRIAHEVSILTNGVIT